MSSDKEIRILRILIMYWDGYLNILYLNGLTTISEKRYEQNKIMPRPGVEPGSSDRESDILGLCPSHFHLEAQSEASERSERSSFLLKLFPEKSLLDYRGNILTF